MAQGGLAHAEPPARPRHAALSKQAVEHHEQVEVEGPPIHLRHLHVMRMNLLHYSPSRSVGGEPKAIEPFANGGSAMIDWIHAGPSVTAAFLGSLVECVEAVTIVLAVGMVRGWRSALLGAAAGLAALAALVGVLGPALGMIPITELQVGIGALLLLFGLSWLRKAVRRAAGMIPLHDEHRVFEGATAALGATAVARATRWDTIAMITTFKAVVLEGIEVVFIVLAVGAAGHMIAPASLGAAGAAIAVALAALVLRRPLTRVPENTLKFAVGVLLGSFGAFWIGEGLGVQWPGADLSILGLAGGFLILSLLTVVALRTENIQRGAA